MQISVSGMPVAWVAEPFSKWGAQAHVKNLQKIFVV